MEPAEWARVKALFLAALDQPEAERRAYLTRASGADRALHEMVESLLESHAATDEFMETPAAALHRDALTDGLPADGRVGVYRLIREIGRGGMGAVYLAVRDDGEFTNEVAIKLVKRGMDTDLILNRFRHERQILAGLDHSNIARLLDGGTTEDGRPYFVMEHVAGVQIREYCVTRNLSITDRLTLFRTVCAAVQYAHQNLIVHRDIKASNVLVTDAGIPKLLDFGIAKLLAADTSTDGSVATETLYALTPEYASPEQIRGESVTTATDVYSLGVVLFEVLTGARPFASRGRQSADIAKAVCDTEPPAPSEMATGAGQSGVRRRLRGDLDTIVLMAMRKDPTRRYGSAEALSDDIRRHLEGRPVIAQRDTLAYRSAKFARRNRVGIAVAAMLSLSLVGGLAATLWQTRVARGERSRAERRFAEVRSLATSFLFELHDAIANLPGATPARALLVTRALTSLDGLARESAGDVLLEGELAVAYRKVGDVQGNSYQANLGDTKGAIVSYRKAVELLEVATIADSLNPSMRAELARSYQGLAAAQSTSGELRDALRNLARAEAVLTELIARDPRDTTYRSDLAQIYSDAGDNKGMEGLGNVGDMRGALDSYNASVRLREALLRDSPRSVAAQVGLANGLMNTGYLATMLGDSNGTAQVRRAVALLERVVTELPNDATRRLELMSGYARLRGPLADGGRVDEAITLDRKLLSMIEPMIASDPKNRLYQRSQGLFFNYLGRDLRTAGTPRLAVVEHRRALAITERLIAADPESAEHRHDRATSHLLLAEALSDLHEHPAAFDEYRRAGEIKEALRITEPANTRHADDLALIYAGMGAVLVDTRDYVGAEAAFRQSVPFAEAAVTRNATNHKAQAMLALIDAAVGHLWEQRSVEARNAADRIARCEDAMVWYRKSSDLWRALRDRRVVPVVHADQPAIVESAILRCRMTMDAQAAHRPSP